MSSQCWEEDLLLPHVSLMWETWVEVRPCCSLPRFHWSLQDKEELCDGLVGGGGEERDRALSLSFSVSLPLDAFSISVSLQGWYICLVYCWPGVCVHPAPETKGMDKPVKLKGEVVTLSVITLKPHLPI